MREDPQITVTTVMGWECGRAESRDGASTASEVDWGDVSEDLAFAGD